MVKIASCPVSTGVLLPMVIIPSTVTVSDKGTSLQPFVTITFKVVSAPTALILHLQYFPIL